MGKKLILLVEDDQNLSITLTKIIESWGYAIISCFDGEDGLNKIKEQKPDLVILDLMLPKLPGEEICRRMKKDEETQNIPVIVQTAKLSDTDRIISRVIGADCYLTKPYDPNDLLKTIEQFI